MHVQHTNERTTKPTTTSTGTIERRFAGEGGGGQTHHADGLINLSDCVFRRRNVFRFFAAINLGTAGPPAAVLGSGSYRAALPPPHSRLLWLGYHHASSSVYFFPKRPLRRQTSRRAERSKWPLTQMSVGYVQALPNKLAAHPSHFSRSGRVRVALSTGEVMHRDQLPRPGEIYSLADLNGHTIIPTERNSGVYHFRCQTPRRKNKGVSLKDFW